MKRPLEDLVLLEHADPAALRFNTVTNAYVLLNTAGQALFIDAAFDYLLPSLRALLREGYRPVGLALTHRHLIGHKDEAGQRIAAAFDIPILLHQEDVAALGSGAIDVPFVGPVGSSVLAAFGLETLYFPGHTEGHVMFYRAADKLLFLGDAAVGPTRPEAIQGLAQLTRPPREANTDDARLCQGWLSINRPIHHAFPLHGAPLTQKSPAEMAGIMQALGRQEEV